MFVPTCRKPGLWGVDNLRDLIRFDLGRKVPNGFISHRVPVGHSDAVRDDSSVLLPHRAGTHTGATNCATTTGHELLLLTSVG